MPGFFGPTSEFDEFLAAYMTPAMESVGFSRAKRMYRLTDGGNTVVVRADLYTPGPNVSFHVDWSSIPVTLRDFLRQDRSSWRPSVPTGLVVTRLTVPQGLRTHPGFATLWAFNDPEMPLVGGVPSRGLPRDQFGPAFREHLISVAIPKWNRALTTEYLLTACDTDEDLSTDSSRYGGPHWTQAILGADYGDPEQASAAIDKVAALNPNAPIIPWLRERLAHRVSSTRPN